MRVEFEYLPVETDEGTTFRPLIPVTIECGERVRTLYFLLDSGADFSVLNFEAAKDLGLSISAGRKRKVKGILQHSVDCVENKVRLVVAGLPEAFDGSLYASKDLQPVHNLLGRDFFEKFVVCFDQKARKISLDDRR